jgi:hypothetical protein
MLPNPIYVEHLIADKAREVERWVRASTLEPTRPPLPPRRWRGWLLALGAAVVTWLVAGGLGG